MARPRIIIADTDIGYIIPLQLKFVDEFFEKVDIEIITSREYFENLFAVPQKADVLIISEELYDSSIMRHNISHIFLMTEQYEEEETHELKVNRIFKYTSIKEIFNEITGKSAVSLGGIDSVKKETQVVLVYSACGGVGKTTLALGMSACLTKNYKRVLYLNAARLQTFQRLLGNSTPITATDVYAKLGKAGDGIYSDIKHVIRKELFSYVPPFKAALMSLGIEYSIFERIIISAKRSAEYDYIIVDADTTFDEDKAKLINIADRVIIVTTQTIASVYSTNVLVSNINGAGSEKYVFVCNDFDKDKDNALISPEITLKFSVQDYIDHIDHYDRLSCETLATSGGIQKTAFLVM